MKTELRQDHFSLKPEDFVDMVSHEMRTPLTSIRASLGLVAAGFHGETTPDQQQALKVAVSSLDRMNRLLDDLLDMSKIRVGRLELHRRRMDWPVLVREVVQSFQPLARERGIQLAAEIRSEKIDGYADPDKIVQILTNLIHNALKFTLQGMITVALTDCGDRIECSVSDTGPGIPPADLPRLFAKFTQLGGTSHTGERGTGLGLALARQLVELHGGDIGADNLSPRGARFSFSIPRLDTRTLFEQEAHRLLRLAGRHQKPLSLAHFDFRNWPAIESFLGDNGAISLMNHFETLLRGSLRGESDFVLQSPGALWLAVYSVNKEEGLRILDRVRRTFETTPLPAAVPTDLESRLACYPDDGTTAAELFSQLRIAQH